MVHRLKEELSPFAVDAAVFMAKANVSVRAIQTGDLRGLAMRSWANGWDSYAASSAENRRRPGAEVAAVVIPKLTRELMNRALEGAAAATTKELLELYAEYPYNCLSIDGVSIGNMKFLNWDVVNASSTVCPFTFEFLFADESINTKAFVNALHELLVKMDKKNLNIAGVTSDGARFQRKGLSWRDGESIQQRFKDEYSHLLFIPCVCHRLQNALKDLYDQEKLYRDQIDLIRSLATRFRKPEARAFIGATCPAHCATRWIYDYPILSFIEERQEKIESFDLDAFYGYRRVAKYFFPLLQKVFTAVRILEADDASVGRVFPVIDDLCTFLVDSADATLVHARMDPDEDEDADRFDLVLEEGPRRVYRKFEEIIRERVLNTTNYLFQLAYVMTPEGRLRARSEKRQKPAGPMPFHVQFPPSSSLPGGKDPRASRFYEEFDHRPALDDLVNEGLVEVEAETDGLDDMVIDIEMVDRDDMRLPAVDGLGAQAEKGLREILEQFGIEEEKMEAVIGVFQQYIQVAPIDLTLKPAPAGRDRKPLYSWTAAPTEDGWPILADIGMRLSSLVCSEAISERTNSQMRRILSPFRMRMAPRTLLARMNVGKHGASWNAILG
jgi:hypothetical protein